MHTRMALSLRLPRDVAGWLRVWSNFARMVNAELLDSREARSRLTRAGISWLRWADSMRARNLLLMMSSCCSQLLAAAVRMKTSI